MKQTKMKRRLAVSIITAMAMVFSVVPAVSYAGTGTTDINTCAVFKYDGAQYYDGTPKTPKYVVRTSVGGPNLVEGTDYTITYNNNVNCTHEKKTATATIKGIGNYYGTYSKTDICSFDISYLPDLYINMTVSAKSYTYNGKTHKPTVKLTSSISNKTIPKKDYTVVYSKGCKNVGTYTVTFKPSNSGNLVSSTKGPAIETFKINPKATSISIVSKDKKSFKASWKKVSSQATGYQLQYALDSKFTKSKKTVTVKSYKTTSKTVKKLKAKKKYYVKARTYKKVGKTTYYSSWSKTKTVTTK